jgi:hypothetical protein
MRLAAAAALLVGSVPTIVYLILIAMVGTAAA